MGNPMSMLNMAPRSLTLVVARKTLVTFCKALRHLRINQVTVPENLSIKMGSSAVLATYLSTYLSIYLVIYLSLCFFMSSYQYKDSRRDMAAPVWPGSPARPEPSSTCSDHWGGSGDANLAVLSEGCCKEPFDPIPQKSLVRGRAW